MCQVFEEADPMGVWNTLIADQCFSVNNSSKVVYIRKPKPLVPETSYNSYNDEDTKARKTTHALVCVRLFA